MRRIYLDTNIFAAFYSKSDSKRIQKTQLLEALSVFKELKDVEFWTSMWAITELVKILTINDEIKMDPLKVAEIEKEILNKARIGEMKIYFAEVSPVKDYDFREFFFDIRNGILTYNSGWGDVMHSVIMKNNSIDHILTFDGKDDFKKIPGFTVLHPKDIKIT